MPPAVTEPPAPVPFEDPQRYPGLASRICATFRLALGRPLDFFHRVSLAESAAAPLRFLLLAALPTAILTGLALLALALLPVLPASTPGLDPRALGTMALGVAFLALVLEPLALLAALGLLAGLFHGGLWLLGGTGARRGLLQTYRATAYALAVLQLGQLGIAIPGLGAAGALAMLALGTAWGLFLGLGLSRVHQTQAWRGLGAVLLPPGLVAAVVLVLLLRGRG